eukprot:5550295-Amphidinium_carterae.1
MWEMTFMLDVLFATMFSSTTVCVDTHHGYPGFIDGTPGLRFRSGVILFWASSKDSPASEPDSEISAVGLLVLSLIHI